MLKPRRANRPGDAGEHAGPVLHEDAEDVVVVHRDAHRRSFFGDSPRTRCSLIATATVGDVRWTYSGVGWGPVVVLIGGTLFRLLAVGKDEVVVAQTGGDHREDLLPCVDAEVDDDGAVVDRVGLVDRRLDLFGAVDADADATHRLGPLDEVGQLGRQVHLGVALVVEHLLPLADHAEVAVVEDPDLDRDALDARGHELLRGHLEAAVAVDRPHRAVRAADLGADRRRHAEAHRAQAAGVDPGVRLVEPPVLAAPHLVLADAADEDRALGGVVAQLLQAELRLQRLARLALLVGQRELLAPPADPALPRAGVGLLHAAVAAGRGSP